MNLPNLILALALPLLLSPMANAAEKTHEVKASPFQEGVYMLSNAYSSTVLELKSGHFRYWFESDARISPEPSYPVSGEYSREGDRITLNSKDIFEKKWSFRTLDGKVTLWRPAAIDCFKKDGTLDSYGILRLSPLSADDAWTHRSDRPKNQ